MFRKAHILLLVLLGLLAACGGSVREVAETAVPPTTNNTPQPITGQTADAAQNSAASKRRKRRRGVGR